MSEYLSKKAVLEHIRREIGITEWQRDAVMTRHMKEYHGGAIRAFQNLEHAVLSGAFDADDSEVQRLRAIEQAIRDFQPTKEQQAGYDALVAWLESVTPFVLKPEKERKTHDTVDVYKRKSHKCKS